METRLDQTLREYEFRAYLQRTLVERCRANAKYSLRSFARSLRVESSALSKILRGERSISRRMFQHLTQELGMGPREVNSFITTSLPQNNSQFSELRADAFEVISDWFHYAILDLIRLKAFRSEAKWIANTLNISPTEALQALLRLERLGFIKKDERNRWKNTSAPLTTTGTPFSVAAFRKYQRQVLEKALDALENIPYEQRDHSAMSMAIDVKLLPEAKERIKRFRRELCQFLENGNEPTEVYHLAISLYPVSRVQKLSYQNGSSRRSSQ